MTRLSSSIRPIVLLMVVVSAMSPRSAAAGPLIDWLFGRYQTAPAYPVGQPIPVGSYSTGYAGYPASLGSNVGNYYGAYVPMNGGSNPTGIGYAGNYGTYYSSQLPAIGPAGAGYSAPIPSGISAATIPSTMPPTLSYVPNFQTNAQRTPVTYYRPLLTTDPNTGAQVVAMAPCTSYEAMAQRVPAFGRTALFGSNAPPVLVAPTQALPTYTLPSGGVPLASSLSSPYTAAYGNIHPGYANSGYAPYTVLQAPLNGLSVSPAPGQAGAYSTVPLGQTPYATSNGGSCGGYSSPSAPQYLPGLVAPQAPTGPSPYSAQPGLQQDFPNNSVQPPPVNPQPQNSVLPPTTDPANIPPTLPLFPTTDNRSPSSLRPQLRSIVRQPRNGDTPAASASSNVEASRGSNRELPTMTPIPVPQDFKYEPRYNPGLLREEDMTALRPIRPDQLQVAGQSKPIHWASFERTTEIAQPTHTESRLRPISSPNAGVATAVEAAQPSALQTTTPAFRKTGGWKASR